MAAEHSCAGYRSQAQLEVDRLLAGLDRWNSGQRAEALAASDRRRRRFRAHAIVFTLLICAGLAAWPATQLLELAWN